MAYSVFIFIYTFIVEMVIPTIYCCHSCVCSDNDFNIDFDFSDSSDDEDYNVNDERKPLLQKEKQNRRQNKKHKSSNKHNKNTLYFYFKENVVIDAQSIKFTKQQLSNYICGLNIGKIISICFINNKYKNTVKHTNNYTNNYTGNRVNPANNYSDDIMYIKVVYKKIYKKFITYYNRMPETILKNELAISFFIKDPERGRRLSSHIQNYLQLTNENVFYSIQHCVSSDCVIWVSKHKPMENETMGCLENRSSSIVVVGFDAPQHNDVALSHASSLPIDVPFDTKQTTQRIIHV